ncbi:MAG TPA: hypothetical protein VE196_09145 [Pseudonocardiaceae bacterium]|nr:hypothetical protein [Pseudonocardiaceae bacterium]
MIFETATANEPAGFAGVGVRSVAIPIDATTWPDARAHYGRQRV